MALVATEPADRAFAFAPAQPEIELVWPGKNEPISISQRAGGEWAVEPPGTEIEYRGLRDIAQFGDPEASTTAVVVGGDRIAAIDLLIRTRPSSFYLTFIDMPRTVVDDPSGQFRAVDDLGECVWLQLLDRLLDSARRLTHPGGVIAVLCGDEDGGVARVLCDERLGRSNRIGTVVWQKAYAPQNMKGMKTLTTVHDPILLYAASSAQLRPVGIRTTGTGYSNPDGDPRGDWKAEHKGAPSRRVNTDFDTFRPPYRWQLVKGELPPGIWRISEMTGVLWGEKLTEAGDYTFTVEVSDAKGDKATRKLSVAVLPEGSPADGVVPAGILEPISPDGKLRVATRKLPDGHFGEKYSAALKAAGGTPYSGDPVRPSPPRYWEFAKQTLAEALAEDRVVFGKKSSSIPKIKQYISGEEVQNQTSWWPGRDSKGGAPRAFAGYSQDARKHLQAMQQAGLLEAVPRAAKPETLLARLINIFAPAGSTVLEVMGSAGDLAAVALKTGRSSYCLTGDSNQDRELAAKCVIPRLNAVIDGKDRELSYRGKPAGMDAFLAEDVKARLLTSEIGIPFARFVPDEEIFVLDPLAGQGDLQEAVLTALGFFPDPPGKPTGRALDGGSRAICLAPDEYLTPELLAALVEEPGGEDMTIAYFRSEGIDPTVLESLGGGFKCVRVPYELGK